MKIYEEKERVEGTAFAPAEMISGKGGKREYLECTSLLI